MKPPPSFPAPNGSDSDDVSWSLCTAAALWKLGKFVEAVGWVQKAASESAGAESNPDSNVRVVQLTVAATELAEYVRDWQKGQDADPASVSISLDFDTEAIDVQSLPAGGVIEIDSRGRLLSIPKLVLEEPTPVAAPVPPKVAPRARTFAGTLPQDARSPLAKPVVIEKKALEPRKGSPSLSRTLPEAMSSPLARRPSSAGPLGNEPRVLEPRAPSKPRTPDAPRSPVVLNLQSPKEREPILDPFASFDEPRLTDPSKRETPKADIEPAVTKRMDDVPTRRIGEGEAWPAAEMMNVDEKESAKRDKPR